MVLLMDGGSGWANSISRRQQNHLRKHRSNERQYVFDVAFGADSTQVISLQTNWIHLHMFTTYIHLESASVFANVKCYFPLHISGGGISENNKTTCGLSTSSKSCVLC